MSFKTAVLLFCFVMVIEGCASIEMASPDSDSSAKEFVAPAEQTNLYIARSNSLYAAAIAFEVSFDGKILGQITRGAYFLILVDPGVHVVSVSASYGHSFVKVVAEKGKNYFLEVTSLLFGVGLNHLEDEIGKKLVGQGKRAVSTLN